MIKTAAMITNKSKRRIVREKVLQVLYSYEMNKERIRRLIKDRKMTRTGLESIQHHLESEIDTIDHNSAFSEFIIPIDILNELKADPVVWKNFNNLPEHYKRIRIGFIDGARERPEEFNKRLRYFIRMTGNNKTFGLIR